MVFGLTRPEIEHESTVVSSSFQLFVLLPIRYLARTSVDNILLRGYDETGIEPVYISLQDESA